MSLIQMEGIALNLGGKSILSGVDLAIESGAVQLVIGPNGAGKSSLLKCLLGLFPHYGGRILIDGHDNRKLSHKERARRIGYAPQNLDMTFNLDVTSFMELSRYAHDDSPRERAAIIDQSLARTEALAFKDAFLDELSGGERQRVLIASALAQEPQILVLDEPTNSLDPGHRVDLIQLMARLHADEGLTLLIVTHDWNEFVHMAPTILALDGGRCVFQGEVAELKAHLGALFGCEFNHLEHDGFGVSLPRYHRRHS